MAETITIGEIVKKLSDDLKPLPEDDAELYKIFINDFHEDAKKAFGQSFEYIDRVLWSFEMLKYEDDGNYKERYKDAILSLGTFVMWLEKISGRKL